MTSPIELVHNILKSGDFNQFLGMIESEVFECKSEPYLVLHENPKRELAKDVSSFANVQGGYIIIGLKTEKNTTHLGDEVSEVRPLNATLINVEQYHNIIKDWIYPEIEGIEIKWFPSTHLPAKGVVAIHIPQQVENRKPFLIKKFIQDEKISEIIFGYAERKRDSSVPLSVQEIQKAIATGRNYESNIDRRFDEIKELIESNKSNSLTATAQAKQEEIALRIMRIAEFEDFNQKSHLIALISPESPSQLNTIFSSSENSLRSKLSRPPTLRYAGWDLEHLGGVQHLHGELIRVSLTNTKVIDLYKDGTFVTAAIVDKTFLAWGKESGTINSLAVIEYLYNFFAFYALVLQDFQSLPKWLLLRVELNHMQLNGEKLKLSPYHTETWHVSSVDNSASQNHFTFTQRIEVEKFDSARLTYLFAREIFTSFGWPEERVPYTKESQVGLVIDIEKIRAIK